jgi:hypothetical protein
MHNIPAIAKKLLEISCEYHQNSDMKNLFVPADEVITLYQEKEGNLPEKVFYLAFNTLEERKFIVIRKRGFYRMPTHFDITADGFEKVTE